MKVTEFQEPVPTLLKGGCKAVKGQVRIAPCLVESNELVLASSCQFPATCKKEIERQLSVSPLHEAGGILLYVDPHQIHWLLVHLPKESKSNKEILLKTFAGVGRFLLKKSMSKWYVDSFSIEYETDFVIEGALEGLLLALYPVSKGAGLETLSEICCKYPRKPSWNVLEVSSYSVHLARAMINTNADQMTPTQMAQIAQSLAQKHEDHVQCYILDEKAIAKEKMGLLLAVSRASRSPPRLVVLQYTPKKKCARAPIALIGKGISYDTGGFSLKTPDSMKTQRTDMSGAATVLAVFEAAVRLEVPYPIVAAMVCAENAIGSASYKLGDTYVSRSGKTIEVVNTDAEGRLVLADAFDYVQEKYSPQILIDVATLTGAATIALGAEAAAILSTDDKLSNQLVESGKRSAERLWPLPLYDEYKEYLSSDIADMKNAGPRIAGTCVAAVFLKQFVYSGVSWAHLDIASVAFSEKEKFYFSKFATGFGVRTLLNWLL